MYILCSYSSDVVSVELHAHLDPFPPQEYAGQHGSTKLTKESPFLWKKLDRTSGMCKALILSSLSQQEERKEAIYFRWGVQHGELSNIYLTSL